VHPTIAEPHLYGLHGGIHCCQHTKHHQGDIGSLLLPRARACFVMKHWRIDVAEGDTILDHRNVKMCPRALIRRTHHAKLPTKDTNLSRSLAPAQLMIVQSTTMEKRNTFFCHLTTISSFPLRVKIPFSMILTAGKSCRGVDSKMAMEYRNCIYHAIEPPNGNAILSLTHRLNHLASGVEIHNHDRLDLVSEGQVSERTGTPKENCDSKRVRVKRR
jgi:hypothetical protein